MPICTKCEIDKPVEDFAWKDKKAQRRSPACRACHNAYSKEHYENNKPVYVAKAKASNATATARNKFWLLDYLRANACIDCGEADIEVLQFDHIEMVGSDAPRIGAFINYSAERLAAEVSKCEVRCANCHVRRTRKQMGWERT